MKQIFRIKDILYGVRKHLGVIISLTVGGLLVGILIFIVQSYSSSGDTSYKVFASFAVSTPNDNGTFVSGVSSPGDKDISLATTLVESTMYIANSEKVCGAVVERLGLIGVTTKSVQKALSMSQYSLTPIIEATLKWDDSEQGIQIMDAFLDVLPGALRNVMSIGTINRIEGPIVTTVTTRVDNKIILELTGIGFLVGLLYCFTQLYIHPTLIETSDVEDLFGMNLMAEVPLDTTFDEFLSENLITNRAEMSSVLRENYTSLAHILAHQIDEDFFCMFVTSAIRGEGRTTVVANLGVELAAMDKRVLLIDFDLGNPNLGSFFADEIEYRHTLNAVYFDDVSAREALMRITPNLYILPSRLEKRHFGIDRFAKKLVSQLEAEFDIVLIDTSPVGEVSDTLYMANVCNNALFIARYDHAWCDVIQDSADKLNKAGATLLGCIVNCVPPTGMAFNRRNETVAVSGEIEETEAAAPLSWLHKHGVKKDAEGKKSGKKKKQSIKASALDDDDDLLDDELSALSAPEPMQLSAAAPAEKNEPQQSAAAPTEKHEPQQSAASEDDEDAPDDIDELLSEMAAEPAPVPKPEAAAVDDTMDDEAMEDEATEDEAMDDEAMDHEAMDDEAVDHEAMDHEFKDHEAMDDLPMEEPQETMADDVPAEQPVKRKRTKPGKRRKPLRSGSAIPPMPSMPSPFTDDWEADYENVVSNEAEAEEPEDITTPSKTGGDWDSESDSGYER